ncbi:MAG: TolC family protein [Rikenellaceae bacterium]|jgi:outer membrane protein TolC|nr:TolC family protein [Rikenellaceae bacterium]
MRQGKWLWLSIALLAVTTGLQAQQATDSLPITLEKAIEIGLSENPTVLIADQEIQRMEYMKKEARGNLLPTVSGSGSFTHNIQKQKMFMGGGGFNMGSMLTPLLDWYFQNLPPEYLAPPFPEQESSGSSEPIEVGLRNSVSGGFSLSLPLFMPTIYKNIRLTEQQILSAVETARQNKITLANQIKKSYYGILLAESSLEVLRRNIEYAQITVNDTRNAFEQGIVSEYDLITAEVQLSNLTPTLIQTENSIRVARLTLNMLLSLPLETRLDLKETLYDFTDSINSAIFGQIDLSDNADLKLLDIQSDMLDTQLELQRAARMPSLVGIGSYQVLSQSEKLNIGQFRWLGSSSVGLQLSIPIFAGFTNKQRESQIKINREQLKLQRDYQEQALSLEAQTALNNIEQAHRQMTANEATRTQAEKGYRISKTRFDVGAGTMVELNNAQMALLQADLNYSQSIYDYMSAQADFDRISGKEN